MKTAVQAYVVKVGEHYVVTVVPLSLTRFPKQANFCYHYATANEIRSILYGRGVTDISIEPIEK